MEYNVQEGTWVQKNDFPIHFRVGHSFVLRSSQLYITGGYSATGDAMVREYNWEDDTWKEVFEFPESKRNGISLVYNEKKC